MLNKSQALKIAQRSNSAVTGHADLIADRRALIAEAVKDASESTKTKLHADVRVQFQRNVALVRSSGKLGKGWNFDKETNGLVIGSIGYYLSPKDGQAVIYGVGGNDLRAALGHVDALIDKGKTVAEAIAKWDTMPDKAKWQALKTASTGASTSPAWIKKMVKAIGSEIVEKGYTKAQAQELLAPFFAGLPATKKATRKAA